MMDRGGPRPKYLGPALPLPFSLPLLFPFRLFLLPPLRSSPEIQLEGLGSAVSSTSGVWGRAAAEIEFYAF